jgi:hypothetical protein
VRRKVNEDQEPDRVLSLAKLKTLEYRMYRKLREKLKTVVNKLNKKGGQETSQKQIFASIITKFRAEAKELCRGFDDSGEMLDKDELDFYNDITELATKRLSDDPALQSSIHDSYLAFLKDTLEGNHK